MDRGLAVLCATLALVAVVGPGCRSTPSDPTRPRVVRAGDTWKSEGSTLTTDDERKVEAHAQYAAGCVAESEGAWDVAFGHYLAAAAADASDEDLVLEVTRKLVERRRLEDARQLLERSTRQAEASGAVWTWLGTVLALQGNPQAAIPAHREAMRRLPKEIAPYQSLVQVYLEADQVTNALAVLDEAEAQPDTTAPFLLSLANIYDALRRTRNPKTGDLQTPLVSVLDRVAALKPERPSEQLRLADLYLTVGENEKALPLYQALLEDNPDLPGLRERLADIYLRADNQEKAVEQLRLLTFSQPTNPLPHYYLGLLALEARRFDDAVSAFNQVLVLRPDQDAIYFDLAIAHLSHRRPAEALEVLARARQRFRPSFQLEFYTAAALSDLDRHADALRHFTTAEIIGAATEPSRLTYLFYFQFGVAYERNQQFEDAAAKFERAIELKPDFADALNYLGYMWAERGQHLERSHELIRRAVELEPDNGAYLDSLAWVLHSLGRSAEALPHQLRAIELTKEPDPILLDHLGDIYHRLDRVDDARQAWKKALELKPNPDIEKKLESPGPDTATEVSGPGH